MEIIEFIGSLFNVGTLIIFFIGWFIFQCIKVWWFFSKWILLGMILSLIGLIWMGIK